MNFKSISAACVFAVVSMHSYAADDQTDSDTVKGRTYMQYEHDYQTTKRQSSDSIKLVHKTPTNWGFEVKFGFYPHAIDTMYQDYYGGSSGLVISKSFSIDRNTYLTPQFEVDFMNAGLQYIVGPVLYHKFSQDWGAYVRYRYQYRDYAESDSYSTRNQYVNGVDSSGGTKSITYLSKGNIGTHRFETGIDYRGIENWRFEYILLYDYAKYTNNPMTCDSYTCTPATYHYFDNKHGYLYNEVVFQYTGFKQFTPYFEVDQKAVSSSTSQEEACLELGFDWYF